MLSEIIAYVNAIKSRQFRSVYFLYGNEWYFIERIIECLKDTVFHNIEPKDIVTFIGSDASWQQIIAQANQYSLFGGTRLIIINNAQSRNFIKLNRDLHILTKYLENPNPSTILVIAYNDTELSVHESILKLLNDRSYIFKLSKLGISELHNFIVKYLARRQLSLQQDAINFLIDNAGDNLSLVVNELDKIILNNTVGSCVSLNNVGKIIVNSRNFNVFDFCRSVVTKDTDRAFLMLREFALGKDFNSIYILGVLYKEFTKLLVLKGSPDNDSSFGYHNSNHDNGYSYGKLRQVIRLLRIYDLKIKYEPDESTKLEYLYELITFIATDFNKADRFLQKHTLP